MGMGFFDYEVALEIFGQSKQPLPFRPEHPYETHARLLLL